MSDNSGLNAALLDCEHLFKCEFENGAAVFYIDGDIMPPMSLFCKKFLLNKAMSGERKPIVIFINSDGGNYSDGCAIYDNIMMVKSLGIDVIGIVNGSAFSSASLLLQACTLRASTRNSRLMVHKLQCDMPFSDVSELNVLMKDYNESNKNMFSMYAARNTKGNKTIKFWNNFTKNGSKYMSSYEAYDIGLIDLVLSDSKSWNTILEKLTHN